MLRAYEERMPGSGQLILQSFKEEGEHRRAMERSVLDAEIQDTKAGRVEARIGQICGFLIGICGLLVCGWVAVSSASPHGVWAGSVLGGATLTGLVAVFIVGRKHAKTKEESAENRKG